MRCLIAESDPAQGELWKIALESQGHVVEWASSTDQAIDALRLHPYDLLLIDMTLPGGGAPIVADVAAREQPDARLVMVAGPSPRGHGALLAVMPNTSAILRRPLSVVDLMVFTDHVARFPHKARSLA